VRDLAATASRLDQEAMVDPLTGLGNRRMLDAGLAAGEPGAVLFVDVDQFKAVNDGHSYAAGDVVLQRVADILRAHCRLHDVVVRFGGDEFIVLLPGIAGPGAAEVGERVRSAVAREPWADVSPGLRVSVSVGAAGAGDDVDATLTLADQALHEAKRGGRDRVVLR
jgi:diguanylate cyclase (GGDEF)-like protein